MTEITNKDTKGESDTRDLNISDIISTIDGIPLPPIIKKSLWNSIGRLITGLVDIPVASLEAKVQQIRSEANALSLITKTASEVAAKEFWQDRFLIDRSVNHFASRLLREQINREKTVRLAIEDLKQNPPSEDSKKEVDPDWLEMFSRIAESKTNEDVQLFLSKILSGEIRNPGTFSPKTIQTLSLLDQKTAKIFQSFCNISFELTPIGDLLTCVIAEPFGSPGDNALSSVDLSYGQLSQLQDAGLIQHDLTAWRQIPPAIFSLPMKIGDREFTFKLKADTPTDVPRVSVINFTNVGIELRKVIHISSNEIYNDKFAQWATTKFKLEL